MMEPQSTQEATGQVMFVLVILQCLGWGILNVALCHERRTFRVVAWCLIKGAALGVALIAGLSVIYGLLFGWAN